MTKETRIAAWDGYQQEALTTAIYPLSRELDYTILGLCSEVGEIGEAYDAYLDCRYAPETYMNVLSEIGDNFWYCAAIADALKLPLSYVSTYKAERVTAPANVERHIRAITTEVSNMAGVLKKSIRDNDGFLSDAGQDKILTHLFRTLWLLDQLCDRMGTSRFSVLNKNLNKLSDRKRRGVLQGSGNNR